jgi:hypothetical protein
VHIWSGPWWAYVIAFAFVFAGIWANSAYRRRSPSAAKGFHPRNRSAWVRLWRQRRADEGKSDPAFLRHGLGVDSPDEGTSPGAR